MDRQMFPAEFAPLTSLLGLSPTAYTCFSLCDLCSPFGASFARASSCACSFLAAISYAGLLGLPAADSRELQIHVCQNCCAFGKQSIGCVKDCQHVKDHTHPRALARRAVSCSCPDQDQGFLPCSSQRQTKLMQRRTTATADLRQCTA